jgi:hypothetical protein
MRNLDFTRMCSTADRPGFAAPWIPFEVITEILMPIRIRHRDKTSSRTQLPYISVVNTETIHLRMH